MLLLTDGSVLTNETKRPELGASYSSRKWYRLTPDAQGQYNSGYWSSALPMARERQFFASTVLRDGRVFVVGGEYSDFGSNPQNRKTDQESSGENFDPLTNAWSTTTNRPQ